MKIIIIGRGNVACNLEKAFRLKNIPVEMVSSREGLDTIDSNADVYIYAVRDEALASVVSQVHVAPRALHVHTSGTVSLDVFGSDKPHAGIFYPFQSFSKEHLIEDFSTIPVFFEARGIDDVSGIYSLALTITSHVYEATQQERERLHVAGVFANNFSNLMYRFAAQILKDTHIPFSALYPLIDETAAKIHSLSPKQAQTGPAKRADNAVMKHHLEVLRTESQQEVYTLLSKLILEAEGGHSEL